MERDQIVLAVLFTALTALLLFKVAPALVAVASSDSDGATSPLPVPESVTGGGPAYMTYSRPYFFAPPVSNFLPNTAAPAQGGATINNGNPNPDGSCNVCGG